MRPLISPKVCGCGNKVDGIAYYTELVEQDQWKNDEISALPKKNVGVFFATFTADNDIPERIVNEYWLTPLRLRIPLPN